MNWWTCDWTKGDNYLKCLLSYCHQLHAELSFSTLDTGKLLIVSLDTTLVCSCSNVSPAPDVDCLLSLVPSCSLLVPSTFCFFLALDSASTSSIVLWSLLFSLETEKKI